MDKLDAFKEFVRGNPGLIKHVKSNDMTWQKFYEIYDLYGAEDNIWNPYLNTSDNIVNWLKNVDINTVQSGINSVQRVVGVLQDFTTKDKTETPKEEYRPRPLYKHFDD